MQALFQPSRLTWRQTLQRFSYYAFGIAALWVFAAMLYLIFRPAVHQPSSSAVPAAPVQSSDRGTQPMWWPG